MVFFWKTAGFFAVWVFLSGKWDLFHLILGFGCAAAVAAMDAAWKEKQRWKGIRVFSLPDFLLRLFLRIVIANWKVAGLILKPGHTLRPRLLRYPTRLSNRPAQTLLSHSITLTPGSICADIVDQTFWVHVLDESFSRDLVSGAMEKDISRVFD
ncbi:MAG: Na+/H+ antiporter subunit E [Elusimicrobia bacterium]|nr:Na+/H+ antiporter subunit E [Elusimicrobiota bacterium]